VGLVELRELLADHLESRVDDVLKQLGFIKLEFDQVKSWIVRHSTKFSEATTEEKATLNTFKLEDFVRLQCEIKNLRQAENKLMLFSAFADAEAKFELVEECVHELDMVLEAAAQLELDIERGK
jgi:hypothetical protein